MSKAESFLDRIFTVADADARIREADDLLSFARYQATDVLPAGAAVGDLKRIPKGSKVRVARVRIIPVGSVTRRVFADTRAEDGTHLGWTSTNNLAGKFVNETLGQLLPQPGAGKYGPNAAWSKGTYVGQKTLVMVVDHSGEVERLVLDTIDAYFALVEASPEDRVVKLTSGFRSYGEQKYLHDGWTKKLPGFNEAAPPGRSRHQNGIAFDLSVPGGAGNPTYDWLVDNATRFGFVRTVNKEPWHWEYDPEKAAKARKAGTFKTGNVVV